MRHGAPTPKLQFGPHGELTHETIKQAHLTKEEEKRAREMMKVQEAYVQILDCLSYPVDPEGHVHDLTAIGPTKLAIAWTMALCGFRATGKKYIKKRFFDGALYADAHTWVDIRSPDRAAEELRPEHKSADYTLPPDTRRLCALRDGDAPQQLPDGWHVRPKITWDPDCEPPAAPTGGNT
jgi:hypothetical protein